MPPPSPERAEKLGQSLTKIPYKDTFWKGTTRTRPRKDRAFPSRACCSVGARLSAVGQMGWGAAVSTARGSVGRGKSPHCRSRAWTPLVLLPSVARGSGRKKVPQPRG